MRKAIFFDRDGTINVECDYLYKPQNFMFIHKAPEAIKLLNELNYIVIVVTNQAGVAKGYYEEEDVVLLHRFIDQELLKYGAKIDEYYYCPHHPDGQGKYKMNCVCRKPGIELFLKAIKDFNIDIKKSWMVGDKMIDMQAGMNLGVSIAGVLTGYGAREFKNNTCKNIFTDIYTFAKFIHNTIR